MTLMSVSQMFSDATPTYLLGRVAILFENEPNYIGSTSMVALNVISFVYMIVVFLFGFILEKKTKKM